MASIETNISNIRTATYGAAVREAIASAIEQAYKKASDAGRLVVDGQEVTIDNYVRNIVENQLDNYASLTGLTDATTRIQALEDLDLGTYKSTSETNFTNLSNADTALDNRLSSVEEQSETFNESVTNIKNRLNNYDNANLVNRTTQLEGSVSELEGLNLDDRLQVLENAEDSTYTDEFSNLDYSIGRHEVLDASTFDAYGYMRAKGTLQYSAPYGTSDFIPVNPGEEITVEHKSIGSAYHIVLYDELKNWFYSVPSTVQANSRVQTQVVVPEGAYYMRVSAPRANPQIDIYRNVNQLKKITDEANNIQVGNHVRYHDGTDLEFTMTGNKRVWINDETSANINSSPTTTITLNDETYPAYWRSNIIDISGYDRLELRAPIATSAGYAFLTGYQVIAAGGSPTGNRNGSLATFILDVPEGADGFVFSCYIGQDVLEEYRERIVNELSNQQYNLIMLRGYVTGKNYQNGSKAFYETSRMNYPPYEKLLGSSLLCIGDSLTVGSLPVGDTDADGNYSGMAVLGYDGWLGELTGITVTKRAQSGKSASSWWNAPDISKEFTSDSYIIWLGTNLGPTGIPAESFSDEPADTELFYYRKIIEEIKSAVPNAKIFLGHVFATKTESGNIKIVNDCIDAIAAAYPNNVVGVAKLDDGSLYGPTKGKLHAGLPKNPHFSNSGYMYLANKWLSEIRRCIAERLDMF